MEKHKCKLCFRKFGNGRALGGHMRSHMLNFDIPQKTEKNKWKKLERENQEISEFNSNLSTCSSSSEEEDEESEDKGSLMFELRENPKKSSNKAVDPEFSFGAAVAEGSVVLQDRESETESSRNQLCRRSKRVRKSRVSDKVSVFSDQGFCREESSLVKKAKFKGKGRTTESSLIEPEPLSSISDTSPEEDVAYCLMMLSRDKWRRDEENGEEEDGDDGGSEEEEEEEEEEGKKYMVEVSEDFGEASVIKTKARGKYRCETCNKAFRSYQALGGHRASHKKIKVSNGFSGEEGTAEGGGNNAGGTCMVQEKIHECPVCFRVFSSGQALGGHKRSHVIGSTNIVSVVGAAKQLPRVGGALIDLNLPAPIDENEISQVGFSAVSDAEFFNPFKY